MGQTDLFSTVVMGKQKKSENGNFFFLKDELNPNNVIFQLWRDVPFILKSTWNTLDMFLLTFLTVFSIEILFFFFMFNQKSKWNFHTVQDKK